MICILLTPSGLLETRKPSGHFADYLYIINSVRFTGNQKTLGLFRLFAYPKLRKVCWKPANPRFFLYACHAFVCMFGGSVFLLVTRSLTNLVLTVFLRGQLGTSWSSFWGWCSFSSSIILSLIVVHAVAVWLSWGTRRLIEVWFDEIKCIIYLKSDASFVWVLLTIHIQVPSIYSSLGTQRGPYLCKQVV